MSKNPVIDSKGTKRWYNKDGVLHRIDGHAIEWANGDRWWYQNGMFHRIEGPAMKDFNGTKWWYQDGKLHRIGGPACEYTDGDKEWYLNDKRHRIDGPAIERANGEKRWYLKGKLHRIFGPAIEWADGTKSWWIKGENLTEGQFLRRVSMPYRLGDCAQINPTFSSKVGEKEVSKKSTEFCGEKLDSLIAMVESLSQKVGKLNNMCTCKFKDVKNLMGKNPVIDSKGTKR